jgi:NACHT domain
MERVAFDALHNSDELTYAPKCHPQTRLAVLDDIMKWINESEAQDNFMMWLFGSAGAGKSAIAKKIAELATEKGLLIGTFFFSRTSPKRNSKDRLIPTLAYQLSVSIPDTRAYIEEAIERDPAIFYKNLQTQIDTLLIKPFQFVSTQITPLPKLIIVDGLDECNDTQAQLTILDAISCSFSNHKLSIIFLVASRPETYLVSSFNGHNPLKSIHRRLSLDDAYHPDNDIRLYLSDKFEQIRCTHRLRSTIPIPWPTEGSLETLVMKSSGQFIFAATVVRFVESIRHRPAARLNIILGISPAGTTNPFIELDGLYTQILSSVDNIQLTLRVLSLYAAAPSLADWLYIIRSAELFLSVEEGDIDVALINLSSIVSYNQSSGEVKILHASLVDFLSDKHRSNEFYIDLAATRTDFACRTLQYVKKPDGIQGMVVPLITLRSLDIYKFSWRCQFISLWDWYRWLDS